ncbi:MAG: hypothetical protein NTV43_17255 [Methylococcales bacterium]|nr:hypothetical protein [Methylococcales bacterium]
MTNPPANSRVILYYNGAISGLTLFVQHPDESVCTPSPLPLLSSIMDTTTAGLDQAAADCVAAVSLAMGLTEGLLQPHPDYQEQVDTPSGIITVYLARLNCLDPPRQLMAEQGCKLKNLTELRNRPPTEMELLRRAYVLLMES